MYELVKKSIVIVMSLVFLTSGLAAASVENGVSVDTSKFTKIMMLYRCGPDGSITPVLVDITLEEGQDVEEAIADKCSELIESDIEIQNFVNQNNSTGMLSKIKSHGRGFHFKTKIRISLVKRIKLFQMLPPYFRIQTKIPVIYCKYAEDARANTTITPLLGGNATYIEGNHTIFALGFVGFVGWLGHFSKSPLDLIPRYINGYAMLVRCKKL